jgi:prolyl oligopeptidase
MSVRTRHPMWWIRCGVVVTIVSTVVACEPSGAKSPPPTRRDNVVEIIHGVEIVDPYRWLEDQESPETRAWIDAQNEYSHSLLDGLPSRGAIQNRLGELMRIDRESAPIERNGRFFIWKKAADDDLWILYLRRGLDGRDEVLLDPHGLSPDHTTTVNISDISSDGRVLAYGIRLGGEDEVEIRLMDVDTRADLPDRLPRGLYRSLSFTKDAGSFYYGRRDRETGVRIFHHRIGTDPAEDTEVFGEGYGPDKWVFASVSDSGRYLLFYVGHGWARSELYIKDLVTDGPITPIVNDIDASFDPQFAGDRLIVMTDWEAPTRRILSIDPSRPDRARWREIVPPAADAIQDFSLVGGRLFVHYLHDVASRISVFTPDGEALGEIPLPGLGSANAPSGRWDSETAFFGYQSFTTPRTIFHYDVGTGEAEPWARDAVPFDSELYQVRQTWYHSKDGTRVPMFIVHRKDLQPDGDTPTLLYGYGGFNVSLTPRFSTTAALWVERGGVYALANIRGGGEFGEEWHRAGMLENKQNVFDDFIAAAEWLIDNNYTNPSKLAIQGGSNGGLLVGAALTQRPELYRAVLCAYPDLDMVRYYQFENNNAPAVLEYGNGADPEQFPFLYAYSPYHRVVPGTEYPAVLLTTGDADTRVPPLQARKMTALLQYSTGSDHPVLLLYDTKAGHSGGKPFAKVVEDLSLEIAFLFWQLGVD